jgi:hypothetical protein
MIPVKLNVGEIEMSGSAQNKQTPLKSTFSHQI